MRRTRHVIAVMVVATALCADRSAVAAPAPQPRPQPTQGFARGLASRITSSFRQAVAPVRMVSTRSTEDARAFPLPIHQAARGVRGVEINPFQFRLPPPAL